MASVAVGALAITLRSFFLPTNFEVTPLGLRRRSLRSIRVIPWQSIRAYKVRATGVIVYQRSDPSPIDLSQSLFVPFPNEFADILLAMKSYLPHAMEIAKLRQQ
ncbi:MAG TPA: hypothetical protein VHU84_16140 [Lacipirellulaceae bacterium]|nr:hypothetical protein [Lacipirellulaceae bacterium]